jgi:membrane-bound metal-dependent hydrolase YbcI (DUF457 family)
MFIGHYAVAFAAKRAAPRVSLGVLVAATSLLDLLWPAFLLLGWEQVRIEPGNTALAPLAFVRYPFSHSLLAAAGWSVLCGLLYWSATRYRSGALVVALVALSHWYLDAVVHRPDLPLYPGSALKLGLGLWNSIPAAVLLEGAMFAGGVWLYASATRATDAVGRYAFAAFVAFMVLAYVGNLLGPPPPSWQAVAWVGLAAWIFPFWAEWFDRRRAR